MFRLRLLYHMQVASTHGEWRLACLARDNNTCQHCGIPKQMLALQRKPGIVGSLHVHHILPKDYFIRAALTVSNGLTLCYTCHRNVHGLGHSLFGPTKEQTEAERRKERIMRGEIWKKKEKDPRPEPEKKKHKAKRCARAPIPKGQYYKMGF